MLATVITSVLLALAAIILRAVLGKKMNGRILMLMWAVVFLKFALPINIPSAVSVMNFFTQTQTVTYLPSEEYSEPIVTAPVTLPDVTYHIDVERPQVDVTHPPSETISPPPVETVQEKPLPDAEAVLKTVYISVTAILCSAIIIAYIFCAVRFSRFEKVQSSLLQGNTDLRKGNIGTPAVFGIIRPKILLPYSTDFTDEVSLRHILLHETTHIRHRDSLWNVLTLLVCAVNWYNPFVWISRVLFLKDTERYCDETVVETIGTDNKKAYAESLLKCAAERSRMLMFVSGFGESDIKSRIKAVMSMKKVRTGTVIVLVLLIIISAAVFGTGKNLSAEITHSDFIPAGENQVYSQIVNGSNGETATINLTLDNDYGDTTPSNYYHFILDFDSEEYTLGDAHATFDIKGLTKYRLIPDEPVENQSEAIIEADFDKENRDIELALYFDYQQETSLDVTVTYELKKGLFTVGEYTMQVHYDPMHSGANFNSYASSINQLNYIWNDTGFNAKITESGYEVSSIDGSTDLIICFDDYKIGAVISDKNGNEFRLESFNPRYSDIEAADFTGDGVNDLIITEHITGTGVIENYWHIIDGAKLCEIPVFTANIENALIDFVNSSVFPDYAAKTIIRYEGTDVPKGAGLGNIYNDDIFINPAPYLSGNLFWDNEDNSRSYISDNIRIAGGICVDNEDNQITGSVLFYLVRNATEYSDVFQADVRFRYEDNALRLDNITYVRNYDKLDEITIFGIGYDKYKQYGYITIDADKYSQVTDSDLEGIEFFKGKGLNYIEVINCKDHDLNFLADIKGISQFIFRDMEGANYEFLRKLENITSVSFENIDGNAVELLNTINHTNAEYVRINTREFSLSDGITFTSSTWKANAVYAPNDLFDGPEAYPTDRPYVVAAPCVRTYLEDGEPLLSAFVDERLKESGNTLTAYFCNPTDEEIYVDWISISNDGNNWVPMADGESSYIPLNITVAPHEEFCFELTKDMFDYSSVQSGIYSVDFVYGYEAQASVSSYFILKHSEENEGLGRLVGDQRAVFEKAYDYIEKYFGCSAYMSEEYASSHTADEFISQFTDALTYECAKKFSERYTDENGNLKAIEADRGGDITLVEKYFYTNKDIDSVNIVCVTAHNCEDISYRSWLECHSIKMVPTSDGWRVDEFTIWW